MVTLIDVQRGGLADAVSTIVRVWSPFLETGQLRLSPNPLDERNYLVLVGETIVARLRVLDGMPVDAQ